MSELNNKPKVRNSNLELLRIIAMLSIIAHHYVVNSGVNELFNIESGVNANALFLQLFGLWGKTAINVFVMISGYFMCKSFLSIKRFSKVYLEAKFYSITIFIVLLIIGYETFSLKGLFNVVFMYARNINNGFTASFLAFYLFIPFYNLLINAMNRKQHQMLIAFLIIIFTLFSTFLFAGYVSSEITWYMTVYFIAAYIRLYPEKWMNNNKICISVLMVLVACAYVFVILVDFVGVRFGFTSITYLTSDSNKILALLIGLFTFLVFKNFNIKNSKTINLIASTTFGVFLIHAGSGLRDVLWNDIVDVKGHYNLPLFQLVLFSIGVTLALFAVCSVIDLIRIYCIEKPVFKWLGKYNWFNKTIG